jgi:hypothetical protein
MADESASSAAEVKPVEPKPWMAQMPDEYKKHEALAQYDGPMAHVPLALVKGYVSQRDEYAKIKAEYEASRPPSEYKLEDPQLPDGVKIDGLDELRTEFVARMKEIGASTKQANVLWQKSLQNTAEEMAAASEADKKAEEAEIAAAKAKAESVAKVLKEGDGKAFKGWGDSYDAEMRHVKLALERFAPKGEDGKVDLEFMAREMKDGTKLGDSVQFVMMFNEIGKRMAVAEEPGGAPAGRGEETLEQRAARLYPETPAAKSAVSAQAPSIDMPAWAKELYANTGR